MTDHDPKISPKVMEAAAEILKELLTSTNFSEKLGFVIKASRIIERHTNLAAKEEAARELVQAANERIATLVDEETPYDTFNKARDRYHAALAATKKALE